jgi:hypothetical protein
MMVDAEDLKARVRAFLVAEKWPINRFAKAVNLTHPTIQNIFDEKWNPRADTLQACLETIKKHRPVTRKEYDKPVHYKIPTNLLDRSENLFFKHCVALWNGQDKFLDTEFLRRLDEIGARGRWSDIYVGPDNRLRIAHYGPDAFGARFHATDTLLMDIPQRDLFDWVEARVWEILGSGTPEFSSCVAPTQSYRAFLQPDQTLPSHRHALREARVKLSRFPQVRRCPNLDAPK